MTQRADPCRRSDGLGAFLEFEAVLGPSIDAAAGQAQVGELTKRFGIDSAALLSGSYGELLSR